VSGWIRVGFFFFISGSSICIQNLGNSEFFSQLFL
jgi:hypothetical protein